LGASEQFGPQNLASLVIILEMGTNYVQVHHHDYQYVSLVFKLIYTVLLIVASGFYI